MTLASATLDETSDLRGAAAFVYRTVLLLDDRDFAGWLALCSADFSYAIRAWSPEIRRDMTWLAYDLDGMQTLVRQLPRHNTDHSVFSRHATVYAVEPAEAGDGARVTTALTVYRTELDGGASRLYAVGRYHDVLAREGGEWRLRQREVRLQTRSLGIGTHYPL
jgi:methanesulfonate monooxygenase small subunit